MYITKVKTNVNDPTTTLSILSVKQFNADFDGDQMNMTLLMDEVSSAQAENLAPHKNMFELNSPRTLSKAASLPKPVVSTISNYLSYKEIKPIDPIKQRFLESLAS